VNLPKDWILAVWFIIMYVVVGIFSGLNAYIVTQGTNTGYRYGLPLFSGMPKQAQEAVLYFNSHDQGKQEAVININGTNIVVVNMTVDQATGFSPNVIVANTSEPVAIQLYSPQVITGFYIWLPGEGVVQMNTVPGMATYEYFVTPNTPGNYTWYEPEYAAYNFSYWNGTLEVV